MDYINSYDYAEVLDVATAKLSSMNEDANEFFDRIREKFIDLVNELMNKSRSRDTTYEESQIDELITPDNLSDAFNVPEHILEKNFDSWDKFMEELTLYETDSEIIRNLIADIFKIARAIGGIE